MSEIGLANLDDVQSDADALAQGLVADRILRLVQTWQHIGKSILHALQSAGGSNVKARCQASSKHCEPSP
jgi:hypothetical protein